MTAPTVEGVQDTIAEYERLAIETGEWDGTETPEFSADGVTWTPYWLPKGDGDLPALCRVTVHRKGVAHPTTVVTVWAESLPADDTWRPLWLVKPTALFGAFTARATLRRAFRDALGDRGEPDDAPATPPADDTPAEQIDWIAEADAAATADELDAVWARAKKARAVTVPIQVHFTTRRIALLASPAPAATETEQPVSTPAADEKPTRPVPTPPSVRPADTVQRPRRAKGGE